tara:strand:+ start:281 stop:466 length:186 start_codon:yes stop_codon:yes gene_type:complete
MQVTRTEANKGFKELAYAFCVSKGQMMNREAALIEVDREISRQTAKRPTVLQAVPSLANTE